MKRSFWTTIFYILRPFYIVAAYGCRYVYWAWLWSINTSLRFYLWLMTGEWPPN